MKTIIAGSRDIVMPGILTDVIFYVKDYYDLSVTSIVSGCARGVDKLGEQFATDRGIKLFKYPADWNKYGKKAGYLRNIKMAQSSEALIALWDGKSRGTKHMIKTAIDLGLVVVVAFVENNKLQWITINTTDFKHG